MNETVGLAPRYDLHTHSFHSDGTEPPREIVRKAAQCGLAGIALTDHDTTEGWDEAAHAARDYQVTLLPGMELSAKQGWRTIHVLAYLIDPHHSGLLAETERIRLKRRERARRIVTRISFDYALEWADVLAQATDEATLGRPHIADALVARGHVPDREFAFKTILNPSAGYIEPHYAPSPERAIALVRSAGGVPVLAHPAARGNHQLRSRDIEKFVDAGLFGLEVDHRENTPDGKTRLSEWAQKYGLVMTGASDYHGAGKPNQLGENVTSHAVVARIVAEATGYKPVMPSA